MKDITFLQSELIRVSNWIEFADKKAGFLGIFYSAVLGFLLTKHNDMILAFNDYYGLCLFIYTLVILVFILLLGRGIYLLFYAVLPDLKNLNTNYSNFYYGTISNKKIVDYLKEMSELTEEMAEKEIIEQIHTNSIIANKKMKSVKSSTEMLFGVIFVLVILILFI